MVSLKLIKDYYSISFICLEIGLFRHFFPFFIMRRVTSKQNVKRYISTSGVYTQIMPGNVTRIDQWACSICVKTGLSCLKIESKPAFCISYNIELFYRIFWHKKISLEIQLSQLVIVISLVSMNIQIKVYSIVTATMNSRWHMFLRMSVTVVKSVLVTRPLVHPHLWHLPLNPDINIFVTGILLFARSMTCNRNIVFFVNTFIFGISVSFSHLMVIL